MKFQTIVIRQASNGYIMSIEPDYRHMEEINLRGHYTPPLDTICTDEAAVVEAIRDAMSMAKLTPPEQPEGTPASMPVEPMADESLDETLARIEGSSFIGQDAQPGETTTHFANGSVTRRDDGSVSIREP